MTLPKLNSIGTEIMLPLSRKTYSFERIRKKQYEDLISNTEINLAEYSSIKFLCDFVYDLMVEKDKDVYVTDLLYAYIKILFDNFSFFVQTEHTIFNCGHKQKTLTRSCELSLDKFATVYGDYKVPQYKDLETEEKFFCAFFVEEITPDYIESLPPIDYIRTSKDVAKVLPTISMSVVHKCRKCGIHENYLIRDFAEIMNRISINNYDGR